MSMERKSASFPHAARVLGLLLAVVVAAPVAAQDRGAAAAESWLPWLGCWELTNGRDDENEIESIGTRQICVVPAGGASAEITTIVDDEVVHSRLQYADGAERTVSEEGCSGVGRTVLSSDGHRLLESGRLQCAGGVERSVSGISMLTSHDTWLDIQVVGADDARELLVRRYRRDAEASRRVLADLPGGSLTLAAETARRAAAADFTIDAVLEASEMVDSAALEAALIESDAWFPMNAEVLLGLADAGVDPTVIDVMVALSFPDYFAFDDHGGGGTVRGAFPVYLYGYYSPAFGPFGWSYYGNPYYRGPPGITIIGSGTGRYGGRVVSGAGYARVRVRQDAPRSGFASALRRGSSRGSNAGGSRSPGTVTNGAGRSSGSSGSKTAKPRGR